MRMSGDRMRNRAEQETLPSVVTVRSEHDQIGAPLFGLVKDYLFSMAIFDYCDDLKAGRISGLDSPNGSVDRSLRLSFRHAVKLRVVTVGENPGFRHRRVWNLRCGDDHDFAAFWPRAFRDRIDRRLAAI